MAGKKKIASAASEEATAGWKVATAEFSVSTSRGKLVVNEGKLVKVDQADAEALGPKLRDATDEEVSIGESQAIDLIKMAEDAAAEAKRDEDLKASQDADEE